MRGDAGGRKRRSASVRHNAPPPDTVVRTIVRAATCVPDMFVATGVSRRLPSERGLAVGDGGSMIRDVMVGAQETSRSGTAISSGTKSFSGTSKNSK